MFEKHAYEIACIDAALETNQHKFQLINLAIADEFNKGYPVIHLIYKRKDEVVLAPFFQAMKKHYSNPKFKVNVVVTDDDHSGYSTF